MDTHLHNMVVSEMPVRLTGIQMQEAIPPEAHELELYLLEGRAVMVEGLNGGGWIYDAIIVDIGGPIITEVVKRVFLHGDMPEE